MKNFAFALVAATALAGLSGCIVAPIAPPPPRAVVVVPAPTYAMPAPGYVWMAHPNYGYGWYHPNYGWHRGWR